MVSTGWQRDCRRDHVQAISVTVSNQTFFSFCAMVVQTIFYINIYCIFVTIMYGMHGAWKLYYLVWKSYGICMYTTLGEQSSNFREKTFFTTTYLQLPTYYLPRFQSALSYPYSSTQISKPQPQIYLNVKILKLSVI